MKLKKIYLNILMIILCFLLVTPPTGADLTPNSPLSMVVKIGNLEKLLNVVEDFSSMNTNTSQGSPTDMIKGMLQGIHWIDPLRQIVVGVEMGDVPSTAVLIPYHTANPHFQAAYNATPGPDYYIVSAPPGQSVTISKESVNAMVNASRSKKSAMLVFEISASKLMKQYQKDINEMLNKIETMPQTQTQGPMAPTPADMRELMDNFFNMANQLKTFQISLDIENDLLKTSMRAIANKRTKLAGIFSNTASSTRFGGYQPSHHITFKSGRYDINGFYELMFDLFGKTYEKMGIDMESLKSISQSFTGEMCGGASIRQNEIQFEMMAVLSNIKKAPDFIEKIYLPWIQTYSRNLARTMEMQLGEKVADIYVRTPDSQVAGHKVYGLKTRFPNFPLMGNPKETEMAKEMLNLMSYHTRMTTVGDLLLIANNDRRMGQLISNAKRLKKQRPSGFLMEAKMDMDRFLQAFSGMMAEVSNQTFPLPKLGKISMQVKMKNGIAMASSTLNLKHFKALGSYDYKGMKGMSDPTTEASYMGEEEKPMSMAPEITEAEKLTKKGNSYAVYGADKAAIQIYKKAIQLDPRRSDAHFNMGISLGEIGEYQKAIDSINQAIDLDPENGKFYFGRGRVYLMSGDSESAFEDFKTAKNLGDEDARKYLSKYTY